LEIGNNYFGGVQSDQAVLHYIDHNRIGALAPKFRIVHTLVEAARSKCNSISEVKAFQLLVLFCHSMMLDNVAQPFESLSNG
jgi:hypothetical protein